MDKWILYTAALGFTAYWASNLLLWFPWSYSATLGIAMMLTVTPLLWAYVAYLTLKTYPSRPLILAWFLEKRIPDRKADISHSDILRAGTPGLTCFGALVVIILFGA